LNEEIEMTRRSVVYKIKIARSVYSVRDEDRSVSVRRQAIYRARFDRRYRGDIGGYPYNIFAFYVFYIVHVFF